MSTAVVAAVTNENRRHEEAADDGATDANPDSVSEQYRRNLGDIRNRIERAERLLDAAGQRAAQTRYGRGMFWGTLMLAGLTAIAGVAFVATGTPAAYGIALPAGGLGAVMSVLQRMSSHHFRVDLESSGNVTVFGAVRPFVGTVFGFLIIALLECDLLNIAPISGSKLALYGALSFFAGFNERFAQDALSSSMSPALPADRGGTPAGSS